jgi:hypothetical protein
MVSPSIEMPGGRSSQHGHSSKPSITLFGAELLQLLNQRALTMMLLSMPASALAAGHLLTGVRKENINRPTLSPNAEGWAQISEARPAAQRQA